MIVGQFGPLANWYEFNEVFKNLILLETDYS